jgi:hypothetical protein
MWKIQPTCLVLQGEGDARSSGGGDGEAHSAARARGVPLVTEEEAGGRGQVEAAGATAIESKPPGRERESCECYEGVVRCIERESLMRVSV